MNKIYFVVHPMNEPKYGRKFGPVHVSWNTETTHCRKYIKRNGKYLESGKVIEDNIYFWGEYEPESDATFKYRTSPRAFHHKLYPVRGLVRIPKNATNTDPYVFGNHFKYICCGIRKKNIKDAYEIGDIVIFGKIVDEHYFCFDTVFVVRNYEKINPQLNTTQYYNASIKPYILSKKCGNQSEARIVNHFIKGVSFFENNQHYSFVPCSFEEHPDKMPTIDLSVFGTTTYYQGFSKRVRSVDYQKWRWEMILDAVEDAGWKIGIQIDKI